MRSLQSVAYLILITGGILFALQALLYNEVKTTPFYVMGILSGVAAVFLALQPNVVSLLLSGIGPYDSEHLTFKLDMRDLDLQATGAVEGEIE